MKTRCRLILVAAATLFAGLAGAQVAGSAGGGPLACAATQTPGPLRRDGVSELLPDYVVTCTGGKAMASGAAIPTVTFTVGLSTSVTSRILVSPYISEAMLLIDEPGTYPAIPAPVPGYGPAAAQNVCSSYLRGAGPGGCVQYAFTSASGVPIASSSPNTLTPPANIFLGMVSENQVIFSGIPILPPVTAGIERVFRIANIRGNVSELGYGVIFTTEVLESVAIDPAYALPLTYPVQLAGFFQDEVNPVVRTADGVGFLDPRGGAILNPFSQGPARLALLQFAEGFASAFKTRVAPAGSESGYVLPGQGRFPEHDPGLADFGTRLKAEFHNIPEGVRVFVSVTNLAANAASPTIPQPPAASTASYAALVAGEDAPYVNGLPPVVSPTGSVNAQATALAEIPIVNGAGSAVWEVLNADPAAIETLSFGVWASPGANGYAALGTGAVEMSFAPTTLFGDPYSTQASASLPVPRFIYSFEPRPILTVGPSTCQYAVTSNGLDYFGVAAAGDTRMVTVTTAPQCSWSATSDAAWLRFTGNTSGSGPGTVGYSVDANPSSGLREGLIWVAGQSVYVQQLGTAAPAIAPRGIVDPWNYTPGVAAGAWVSIYGSNLASVTQDWQPQPGAKLPTTLGGVTVSIDGIVAPLQHVSPYLINALVPAGVHEGQVEVIVSNNNLSSAPIGVTSTRYLPAIYSLPAPSYPRYYVTAVDPSTGQYLGNVTADRRVARAVRPGDTIDLYAIGLGPTTPAFPTDTFFSDAYTVSSPFQVVLGPSRIVPVFAQLIGPGLYQVRITVPLDMPAGDQPIWIDFGTIESAQGVYLTVQQ